MMKKSEDRSPFERLHIPDTFENVLRAVVKGPKAVDEEKDNKDKGENSDVE